MSGSLIGKYLLVICFCFYQNYLFGQVYTTDDGVKRDKHFIYQVKEIDEFFERFNDDPASFIRAVYRERHRKFNITRQRLIKSLFNYENTSWDSTMMLRFVSEVTNKKNPIYLDFYGDNWYAELTCRFRYNSSSIVIPVVMKIEMTQNGGSKWMIVGVGQSRLKSNIVVREMAESKIKTKCLSPTSHATNFVSLKRALDDKENLSNYFENSYFNRSNMLAFYNAVLNRQIEFSHVIKIKYHFLLADKWIFTVEDFPRETLYSGWLINHMQKVSSSSMENYKNKLLGVN